MGLTYSFAEMEKLEKLVAVCAVVIFFAISYTQAGTWTTIDKPGANGTEINGIDGNTLAGNYYDASSHGFIYNGTSWTTIDKPGANDTYINGISGNNLIGEYYDWSGQHGCLYDGIIWTNLDHPYTLPKSTIYLSYTSPHHINGNIVVGEYYFDSSSYYVPGAGSEHGFIYNMTTKKWTTIDYPGAWNTWIFGFDGEQYVGGYDDESGIHGFIYNGTDWTTLDMPGAVWTQIWDIDGNNLVGQYKDASSAWHGFFYNGTTWISLDYPGVNRTFPSNISGNHIAGWYRDTSGGHGFVYTFSKADFNIDGKVDMVDFAILAGQWQGTHGVVSADIAPSGGDGIVDFQDLAVLATEWLDKI